MAVSNEFEIRKLVLNNGVCPFDEWFESLPAAEQYMVDSRFLRVRLGNFGDINNVGKGVWELKFKKGPGYRIYYGRIGKEVVLLLVSGDKRTQKKDIDKAIELFNHYKLGGLKDEKH